MSVYIVTDGKYFKIGYTDGAVEARIDALQTGNPNRLILVHQMDGSRALEKELHGVYAAKRLSGEWFDLTNKDLTSIKATFCPACGSRRASRQDGPSQGASVASMAVSSNPAPAKMTADAISALKARLASKAAPQSKIGVALPAEIPLWQIAPGLCESVGNTVVPGQLTTKPDWFKIDAVCIGHDLRDYLGQDAVCLAFRSVDAATTWRGVFYWQLRFSDGVDYTLTALKDMGWAADTLGVSAAFEALATNDVGLSGLGHRTYSLVIGLDKNNNQEIKGVLDNLSF